MTTKSRGASNQITIPYQFDPKERPYQLQILGNSARNKVLVLHRRAGKSTLAINKLIIEAMLPENSGKTFWYIAPTYRQGKEIVWDNPNMLFKFLPECLIDKRNESELWVKTTNNTRIAIQSGGNIDALRGADPFGVVIDETQDQDDGLYKQIIQPVLAANGGWIWFLGTPKIKDHFFRQAVYAKHTPGWQFFHLSALTSGVISAEELEEIKATNTMENFRQEYLAEFLDGEGAVFRNIDLCAIGEFEEPVNGHWYSIGVDLGRKNDYTVITVYDQSVDRVVYIERFSDIDWYMQKIKIENVARRYASNGQPSRIKLDATGVGDPIFQDLQQRQLYVTPMVFTNTLKEQMVNNLQVLFDNKKIVIPKFMPLIDELGIFQSKRLPSGRYRYSHPDGDYHDDCVWSLAMALYQSVHIDPDDFIAAKRKSLLSGKYREKGKRWSKHRY